MIKKAAIVSLLITALTILAGCGGQAQTQSSSTQGSKHYKIVYIAGIASDPYYIALNRGAQDEAKAENATVQFSGSSSAFSPSTQLPYLNSAITQNRTSL